MPRRLLSFPDIYCFNFLFVHLFPVEPNWGKTIPLNFVSALFTFFSLEVFPQNH